MTGTPLFKKTDGVQKGSRRWGMKKILGKVWKMVGMDFYLSMCQLILLSADVCIGVEVEPVNLNSKPKTSI